MPMRTLGELAGAVNGELLGPPGIAIEKISGIENADPSSIVYVENEKRIGEAEASPAAALLVPLRKRAYSKPVIAAANPKLAFASLLELFYPPAAREPGIAPTAAVHAGAVIGAGASVGAGAVIERGARIGARARVWPLAFVGEDAVIGDDSEIHPGAKIMARVRVGKRCAIHAGAVIGGEGFGFATDESGRHKQVPQVGTVVLGDDVSIGCNTTVDRATLGETIIGNGTKIDNLVHVAHNCRIGENCLIAAMAGIAGSVTIGSGTIIGGMAGFKDHVNVGEKCIIAAGGGLWGDLEPGSFVSGIPARPHKETLKILAALARLPDLIDENRGKSKGKKPKRTNS